MAELFLGGAVGAAMGEIANGAIQTIQNGRQFGPTLEKNEETLNQLTPYVEKINYYNHLFGRPREEIERLDKHIREGKELVRKSKKLTPWKFLLYSHYQTKLKKKDEDFLRYLAVNWQVDNRRDVMEMLAKVNGIFEIIMRKEGLSGNQIWGLNGNQFGCLWGVPQEPGHFVGMDEPLNNLKIELIRDGVSVHVLNGFGGSGTNTLAKKLCWDPQIKGKFGGNIFFITISATPNLKNIVQTLFEHRGLRVPEFHNDEDAINRLGRLLRKVGKNPILLVLDNVWPGSESLVESLVEMLQFQMQDAIDCKILVTSREDTFTRFGTQCELYPLQHDHAVSLFLHFAQLNHSSSYMPDNDLLHEIVKGCRGLPWVLQFVAGLLCQQPFEMWQNMKERLNGQVIYDCIQHPYFATHVPHRELTMHPDWWIGQNQPRIIGNDDGNGIMKKLSTMMENIVLWRRKKLNIMIIVAATGIWVLMEVYQFNFLTLILWLTIFVVASMFFYSNMLICLGKEPPNLLRLELKEETAVRMAKTIRALIQKSIRRFFIVSRKKNWPEFVGVVAWLLAISYVGNCMDFLTFIYIGILAGMTLPATYIKNKDKIKRSLYWGNFYFQRSIYWMNFSLSRNC